MKKKEQLTLEQRIEVIDNNPPFCDTSGVGEEVNYTSFFNSSQKICCYNSDYDIKCAYRHDNGIKNLCTYYETISMIMDKYQSELI